jgi:hypothetical protein
MVGFLASSPSREIDETQPLGVFPLEKMPPGPYSSPVRKLTGPSKLVALPHQPHMPAQTKTAASELFEKVSRACFAPQPPDEIALRRFERELEQLRQRSPMDVDVCSTELMLATMRRDRALVESRLASGRQRMANTGSELVYLMNAVYALFNVASFAQSQAVMDEISNRWPHDTDAAQVGVLCALMSCQPRRALALQNVRTQAGVETPNNTGIQKMLGVFERHGITDDEGAALAQPLLALLALHTHNVVGTEMTLHHIERDPEDGHELLTALLEPRIPEDRISDLLGEYFDALGAVDVPLHVLKHFGLDVRAAAKADVSLAA